MRRPSTWLLPVLLAAGQLALWPGLPLLRGEPLSRTAAGTVTVVTVVVAVALLWRRRAPVATAVTVLLALTAGTWAPDDALLVIAFADLVTLFSVAVHRSRRLVLAVGGGSLAWQSGWLVLDGSTGPVLAAELAVVAGVYLTVVAAGRRRARWHAERAAAASRLAGAETRRARAADDERHRLARELHDVAAHHLTSIVVSVSAARRLTVSRPDLVAGALTYAARTGRETLAALHRLVDLMGLPADPPTPAALAAGARALGRSVTVDLRAGDLPPEVAAAAGGIAREALTNALRYAPGAPVRITLTRGSGAVRLTVDDDGGAPGDGGSAAAGLGGGRGIGGMRERAAALGGTLTAGPRDGGGWRVGAVLPVAGPQAAARGDRPWSGHVIDATLVIVALLGPAGALAVLLDDPGLPAPGQPALIVLAAAAHGLPLLARRRRPWGVLAAVSVTGWLWPALVAGGALSPGAGSLVAAGAGAELLAVHAVARYGRRPALDWLAMPVALALLGSAAGTALALIPAPPGQEPPRSAVLLVSSALMALVFLLPVVVAWLAGFLVRRRRDRVAAREEQAVAVAAYLAWAGAGAERARVAAGLRAAVPRHTGAVVAAADAGDLDGVLREARAALDAMRGLLNGLRDGPAAERSPQPTLASVAALADRWRAHGREVSLAVEGPGRDLPADVDVSAYRVVELLLAADTGPAAVRVHADGDLLRITVCPAPADPDGEVAAGLRARAAAVGGEVRATPDGLEVRLPARTPEVASSPSA